MNELTVIIEGLKAFSNVFIAIFTDQTINPEYKGIIGMGFLGLAFVTLFFYFSLKSVKEKNKKFNEEIISKIDGENGINDKIEASKKSIKSINKRVNRIDSNLKKTDEKVNNIDKKLDTLIDIFNNNPNNKKVTLKILP